MSLLNILTIRLFNLATFIPACCVPILLWPEACLGINLTPSSLGPKNERVDVAAYHRLIYVNQVADTTKEPQGTKVLPYSQIRSALDHTGNASPNHRVAVLVSMGTYAEDDSLQLRPHLDLFGGFSARDWSRDIHQYKTILSTRGTTPNVVGSDHARIDGFVITGARSNELGGGMICRGVAPTISNNWFIDNRTVRDPATINAQKLHQKGNGGGAICCIGAAPLIRNNWFDGNQTDFGDGGAIWCYDYSSPELRRNVFHKNVSGTSDPQTRSSNGGALACSYYSSPVVSENLFLANSASGRGDGGAIYGEYFSAPRIRRNVILGNTAEDDGAGCYFMSAAQPVLRNNLLVGNGPGGGTLRLSKNGRAELYGNIVVGNLVGGIVCRSSSLVSVNNIICQNLGGAISGEASVVSSRNDTLCHQPGSGMQIRGGSVHVINTIVAGNAGSKNTAQMNLDTTDLMIAACVVASADQNDPQGINAIKTRHPIDLRGEVVHAEMPKFRDDAVQLQVRLVAYDDSALSTIVQRVGNSNTPSGWVGRPVKLGETWTVINGTAKHLSVWGDLRDQFNATKTIDCWVTASYRLASGSVGINHGVSLGAPREDIDGDPRPRMHFDEGRVDIGADEYTAGESE